MSGEIIGEIKVTPTEVLPGQSVLVEVCGPDGKAYNNAEEPRLVINGVAGSRQYLQFARPGDRTIYVAAEQDGKTATATVSVKVKQLEGIDWEEVEGLSPSLRRKALNEDLNSLPLLHVASFHEDPYRAAFSVGGWSLFRRGLSRRRPINRRARGPTLGVDPASLRPALRPGVTGATRPDLAPAIGDLSLSPTTVHTGKTKYIPAEAKLLRNADNRVVGHHRAADAVASTAGLVRPDFGCISSHVNVYRWDFGDGNTETTYSTRVEHDYQDSLDPNREHQQFDVSLQVQGPDGSVEEVKRTLTIHNAYAMCKKSGVIIPRTQQSVYASVEGFGFSAALLVTNVEPFPLKLSASRIRVIMEDPEDPSALGPLQPLDPPIVIPAGDSLEIPVFMPFSRVPRKSAGFTVHYFGNTDDGKAIRIEGTFDTRAGDRDCSAVTIGEGFAIGRLPGYEKIFRWEIVTRLYSDVRPEESIMTSGTVEALSRPGSTITELTSHLRPVGRIAEGTLATDLGVRGINRTVLGSRVGYVGRRATSTSPGVSAIYALSATPQPVEGAECDPDNLPELTQEQLDDGWACQATPELREVVAPSRFLNALKGDIVLDPGTGIIGGLLRQVVPPQRYSHCGIMTRNYDQITHSTTSEDRLLDYPNGSIMGEPAPSDGFVPNAMKYQWPGVVTQSVEDSIFGEPMVDPDSGQTYDISSFSPGPAGAEINGHWEIIPPLVIKPDPLIETPEIRAKLWQIANDALAQTGNSHYRLYCYTDPTIGQRPEGVAPASAGWAAGTYPSVCSSFVWMAMKRQGVHLESINATVSPSDLETLDLVGGAQVDGTPDGLYLYTASERLAAAEWLKEELIRMVERQLEEDAGILAGTVDLFSDMSDDVSNQMLNTFASDWSATAAKDSEDWRNISDTNAVSPDNLLFWDSPAALGLYGFAVPLSYRSPRLEEVVIHRWRKVPTQGKLSGRVWYNGNLVSGALVQVYDGKTVYSDGSGYYEITGIPFGPYTAKAYKNSLVGNVDGNASVPITINQPQHTLDITLSLPADHFRRVQIHATIDTTDDEWGTDEYDFGAYFGEVYVGPWNTHEEVYFEQRMGGEIRIELRFNVDWNMDRSVTVTANAKMYEGTSESTDDLDDEENAVPLIVPKDHQRSGSIRLYNEGIGGGDTSAIEYAVVNLVQDQ